MLELPKNPFYKTPELRARAEQLIHEAMFTLREETECDLTTCHLAMVISCFNVMRKFSTDEVMFNKMYEQMLEQIEYVFANIKKQTHESPGRIQ